MKMNMYCVYDRVIGEATAPFLQKNDDCARRAFVKLMRETGMAGCDDFELVFIGTFNSSTMDVVCDEHFCIMLSKDVEKVVEEES